VSLADAIKILNRFRHRATYEWHIDRRMASCGDGNDLLEFEAVAIAEKYLREDSEK
jgi:hypothetical protein